MKAQRAYVEHVIECIRRIAEDSAPGWDTVLASRTLQDAIVRNLQVLCESTQRIDESHKERHPEMRRSGMLSCDLPPLEKAMRLILTTLDQPH